MSVITNDDLVRLFSYFAKYPDTASKREDELMFIQAKCNEIFAKDYNVSIISNRQGELCATYPLDLVIMEGPKDPASSSGTIKHVKRSKIFSNPEEAEDNNNNSGISSSSSSDISSPVLHSSTNSESSDDSRGGLTSSTSSLAEEDKEKKNDASKLEPMFQRCRFARVRTRFPVPVIWWNNKNICRSSTLSQKMEYMLQAAHNTLLRADVPPDMMTRSHMESLRNRDIVTIKQLGVKYILDLMMENKKKKFGFTVCSSEKVDMHERYATFTIASIPYPGVEFFQEFNQRKHVAHDLHFDWEKCEDAVELKLDEPAPASHLISWRDYKTWDLILLTKNYLKLMLVQLSDPSPDAGLLVHCISGWDRTPLFISLLRISLWADKQIHQSLHIEELLYLTVAYDWLLFSHQLYDRASRGEDIFYFCFYFLQFIQSSDFSVPISSSPSDPPIFDVVDKPPEISKPVPKLSEQEQKEVADSRNLAKAPSIEKFQSVSAKLNGSSNSLPNLGTPSRSSAPPFSGLSGLSASFKNRSSTPSIPIASADVTPSMGALSISPSPTAISTSFSLISSTPHSYKGNYVYTSASSSTNSSGSSTKSTSHNLPSSFKSNGVSIPHSHGHSHSHVRPSHSHSQTPAMEISHHRGHKPRKLSDSCDPTDCTCGSWQMVSEFSFSDKNHPHPHLSHPTPPSASDMTNNDSDDDSTDSSSHFDPVDTDFTGGSSWENDGVFPQDLDERPSRPAHAHGKSMHRSNSSKSLPLPPPPAVLAAPPPSSEVKVPAQLPGEPRSAKPDSEKANGYDSKANGHDSKTNGVEVVSTPRAARLAELQHMGMRLYDQCCRSQAGNRTFLQRFLPRFV